VWELIDNSFYGYILILFSMDLCISELGITLFSR